jgi:hypothetical protein
VRRVIRIGFSLLLGWQLMTALINVATGRWDWVAFDLACAAIVIASWLVTERSLREIKNMDRERDAQIGHYRLMLDDMRRSGSEEGEKFALTMLTIWGWKGDPVPDPPPGQGDQGEGGLSS